MPMGKEGQQAKLCEEGIELPDTNLGDQEDHDRNIQKNDKGEPIREYESKGGYNLYEVKSLLFKAIRRGDEYHSMWAAYELCRSGADIRDQFWERIHEYCIMDTRIEDAPLLKVKRLEEICKEGWSSDPQQARMACMGAAKLLAQAKGSKELEHLKRWWDMCAYERAEAAKEGREPEYDDFPDLSKMPEIFDRHTYRGASMDRGSVFWHEHASKVTDPTDVEKEAERKIMENSEKYDEMTEEEIQEAVEGVEKATWGESEDCDP